MKRLLAALFLILLVVECVPAGLSGAGCDMPCCKRAGKGDCCPRRMQKKGGENPASDGCRMVACGSRAPEANPVGPRQPALLEAALRMDDSPRALPAPELGTPAVRRLALQPPTPPPRNPQV